MVKSWAFTPVCDTMVGGVSNEWESRTAVLSCGSSENRLENVNFFFFATNKIFVE